MCKRCTSANKRAPTLTATLARTYTIPVALWPRRPAAHGRPGDRLRRPPQCPATTPHTDRALRWWGGAGAFFATPAPSLSVLREMPILNQHRFVNLFHDKVTTTYRRWPSSSSFMVTKIQASRRASYACIFVGKSLDQAVPLHLCVDQDLASCILLHLIYILYLNLTSL